MKLFLTYSIGLLMLLSVRPMILFGQVKSMEEPVYFISHDLKDGAVDAFNQIYLLGPNNEVERFDEMGKSLFFYANSLNGEVSSIDLSIPQKPLLYSKDANRIILLDNTLAEINILDLTPLGYFDVSCLTHANDGNFWVYDKLEMIVFKMSQTGEVLFTTNRFSDFNISNFIPERIEEQGNKVWLNDPDYGVVLLDNFGSFLKTIPIRNISDFQMKGKSMYFSKGNAIYQLDPILLTFDQVIEHHAPIVKFHLSDRRWFIFDDQGVVKINAN